MAIDIRTLNGGPATAKTSVADTKDSQKPQAGPVVNTPPSPEDVHASDKVQITSRARELQGLIGKLSREPAFDAEKVARLREEVSAGRYSVNSQRVAARLLGLERELNR
ncbi:MAG: flagellar biosynthesis anti-sigma factor FlgM [Gammaproteobacteria bacterium]|nr:flagellar biosynthesis anti-sigma factor FlgM [Gammaproteobacteria bacterium]